MKVLVMGGTGMLGHKLVQRLSPKFDIYSTIRTSYDDIDRFGIFERSRTIERVDLSNENQLRQTIERIKPDEPSRAPAMISTLFSSTKPIATAERPA